MVRLIGLGNEWAGDDAVGLEVARLMLPMKSEAFDVRLMGVPDYQMFDGLGADDLLLVVDACQSGAEAGVLMKYSLDELHDALTDKTLRHSSSHGLNLQHWLQMKQELEGIECKLEVYAIEIGQLEMGAGLSSAVASQAKLLADKLADQYAVLESSDA